MNKIEKIVCSYGNSELNKCSAYACQNCGTRWIFIFETPNIDWD